MGNLFSSSDNLPQSYVRYGHEYSTSDVEERVLEPGANLMNTTVIDDLVAYTDARNLVLAATRNPQSEAVNAAWQSVHPKVVFMNQVYEYCEKLTNQVVCLFSFLSSNNDAQGIDALNQHPAITLKIIEYLSTCIFIDSVKMTLPNMLMDLAYFRRVATRVSNTAETQQLYQKSSKISIFLGQGAPTIARLIELAKSTFSVDENALKSFLMILGSFINTCAANVKDTINDEGKCLRAMTAAFLVYDELNKDGAFHKRTDFAVIQALTVLVHSQPSQTTLVDTIKYSSKHLKDSKTIPEVRTLLNV